jgi:hypothetical protein
VTFNNFLTKSQSGACMETRYQVRASDWLFVRKLLNVTGDAFGWSGPR